MRHSYSFGGLRKRKFKISAASVVLGQPVIWLDTSTGSVTDPAAATDLTDAMGVTTEAGTQSTTQGTGANSADVQVEVIFDPLSVFRAQIFPSATVNTQYAVDDGYLLTVDTQDANGLLVIDADCGGTDADADNGYMFATDGANVDQVRVITAHDAGVDNTVVIPYDLTIEVGDHFVFSQYAPGVRSVDLTSDFTGLNGATAGGTDNAEAVVVDVYMSTDAEGYTSLVPRLEADIIFSYHAFNSLAVA